jgi:hypothetical protein
MRFTFGFLPRRAVAYAFLFLALATLTAFSQDAATPEIHGIVVANMDRSVKAGDDFFQYANGEWLKHAEIPADQEYVAVESALDNQTDQRVADLIAEVTEGGAAGDKSRRIADLFNSYMDEAGIAAKGLSPLRPHLDAIAAIRDKHELARALGESLRADVDGLDTSIFIPRIFSGFGSRPTLMTQSATRGTCYKAGWYCRIVNTTFPTASKPARYAANIRRTSRQC